MDLLDRLNLAVEYVERNITQELDLSKIARLACCSTYNFQRMFSFVTDVSIVEYIRRGRLTLAALELQHRDMKVIDVALKYGYDSPVSFARAFQAMHGITPSEAKNTNVSLKAFPRMTFQIIIKGVGEMNYRIVKTEPFKVFGIEGLISTTGEPGYFRNEGEVWNDQNDARDKLYEDAGKESLPIFDTMFVREMCPMHGLMNYNKVDDTTYGFMLWCFLRPDSRADRYTVYEVPAATWAVFPRDLDNWDAGSAISTLNKRFYSEWLPTSEYEKADAPELEMYSGTPEKGHIELWMPIIKKKQRI